MAVMARYPDKYFDLAIVDPPYGINAGNMTLGKGKRKKFTQGKDWDKSVPTDEYWNELQRISCHQIIWGGNYFDLPPTKSFLIWDKINDDRDFAECEYAWTSFDSVARVHRQRPQNMDGGKIHPTQKPVKLYWWILNRYAKPSFKILDTHLGSGSNAIAAHQFGIAEFIGCEIDKDYYDAAVKRFNLVTSQTQLFKAS